MTEPVITTMAKRSALIEKVLSRLWEILEECGMGQEALDAWELSEKEDFIGLCRLYVVDFDNHVGFNLEYMADPESDESSIPHDVIGLLRNWSLIDHETINGFLPRFSL